MCLVSCRDNDLGLPTSAVPLRLALFRVGLLYRVEISSQADLGGAHLYNY